jgi:hypothetical protein
VPVTCAGPCTDQATCIVRGGNQCVCLGLGGPNPATCGQCIPDASPTNRPEECCSGQYCLREQLCGPCPAQVCAGTCADTAECQLRGGSTCQCAGGTCQTAVGPITTCPSNYTGNAKSPCDSACPCRGGRRCQNGRCCEQKRTHCKRGKECCSGRCKRIHANHRQCA